MLSDAGVERVYLACGSTDLRKSIDSLAALVKEGFNLDPFSPCLFAFCNRGRDKVKILHWDHNGFWLYYKRLERGRFEWPDGQGMGTVIISHRQFRWILDGLSPIQHKAHRSVTARTVV